jgi:methylmalonyl-CoA mutase
MDWKEAGRAFPAKTLADWRAEVAAASPEVDPGRLSWRTSDGLELKPLYTAADRADFALPSQNPHGFRICAVVDAGMGARTLAEHWLRHGADTVRVRCARVAEAAFAEVAGLSAEQIVFGVDAAAAARTIQLLEERDLPHRVVADLFADVGGAGPAAELGYTLAWLLDLLRSHDPAAIARRSLVPVRATTDLCQQIAKTRAAALLWRRALAAAGAAVPAGGAIYALGEAYGLSDCDPHTNLARTTLQGFGAAAGGASFVELPPWDGGSEDGARLAMNQLLLLRDEAHVGHDADPLGGAFAIEAMTAAIAARADRLAHAVEAAGGFSRCGRERAAELCAVAQSRAEREALTAHRTSVLVGVNAFVDPTAEPATFPSGAPLRAGAAFERLRRRTRASPPTALLLPVGAEGAARARADFASDLLRAAGFTVVDPPRFETLEGALAAAARHAPGIVVLCSDDASYTDLAPRCLAGLQEHARPPLLYLAGPPLPGSERWGHVGFLHAGLDAAGTLAGILDRLGIGDATP